MLTSWTPWTSQEPPIAAATLGSRQPVGITELILDAGFWALFTTPKELEPAFNRIPIMLEHSYNCHLYLLLAMSYQARGTCVPPGRMGMSAFAFATLPSGPTL